MKNNGALLIGCALLSIVLSGCNRYQVIPDHLAGQVKKELSYEQVKDSPDAYRGKLVVWGGEVLGATRNVDHTKVEVFQLPVNKDHIPLDNRSSSQGRFLAVDSHGEIIDPAILMEGLRVTVIGEIMGSRTETRENAAYDYPVIAIRDMTVWDEQTRSHSPFVGYKSYYGYGYYGRRPYSFSKDAHASGG
jgi:outer membrane lipoprotein